ncbi:MAG: Permease of the drug/metabolite transporter (DMT) superfamily [uncultured Ramlibacter sp.]|uniref:Permease of the drug/metabolite transporter (DMT) superfamily n=1 Tax=uncultured Ramlibacter sp. TaxID=260755 RepID=A0A6J4Q9P9_9BURK|nr:MAG: Permease of the drug/metabolite transporter (DMT) superfamily [uncultured Ramlibacter sp.]
MRQARCGLFAALPSPTSRVLAFSCLALSMTLVGSYVALSKPLVAAIPVFLLAWLRFGIGGLAMVGWLRRPVDEAPLSAQTRRLLFLESFLGNFLFSICMLYGVSMTSAVSAGVIMASIPAVVAVMSWLFLREAVPTRVWAAVACAGAGIALLAIGRSDDLGDPGNPLLGNLLVFGAVLCEASYAVIGKKLTGAMGPRRITALVNLWGLVLVTPFGLYQAWDFDFGTVAPATWLLLLFYSLAASVWTVWLWMTGMRQVPAALAGVFTVMLPISAAVVGVLVLGEPFGRLQAGAFVLALAGVLLATLPVRSAASH